MWPDKVIETFRLVPDNPRENDYYAPYNKLLCWVFPVDSDFIVAPQSYPIPESRESIDFVVEYTVLFGKMPVFILEIKEPSKLDLMSSRHRADRQIRSRLKDLSNLCKLPILYAASAYGTTVSIYSKQGNNVMPEYIRGNEEDVIDTAPSDRWNIDIISSQGYAELMSIFNYIKSETSNITVY